MNLAADLCFDALADADHPDNRRHANHHAQHVQKLRSLALRTESRPALRWPRAALSWLAPSAIDRFVLRRRFGDWLFCGALAA